MLNNFALKLAQDSKLNPPDKFESDIMDILNDDKFFGGKWRINLFILIWNFWNKCKKIIQI